MELREKGIFISVFQWWTAARRLLPEIFTPEERAHACAEETSVNLALHPHLVDMTKAVDEGVKRHPAAAEGVTLPLATADFTDHGVWGKSTTALAEKGRKVFEAVVEELVRHVNRMKEAGNENLCKPKV